MAKYISVLDSSIDKPYWEAVQWGETVSSVQTNPYYNASYNQNYPKNANDAIIGHNQIKEVNTQTNASVTLIKLNPTSVNFMKLANNKASLTFIKKLKL